MDLGTGDGRSVARAARRRPDVLYIGIDAEPTRMRWVSRHAPENARFVVAAAEALPAELDGAVEGVSIYFPWASLLRGLVAPSAVMLGGIARVLRPGGTVTALLSSITERDGYPTLNARSVDRPAYTACGLEVTEWRTATPREIAASDSSWAKRLRTGGGRVVWRLAAVADR